MLLVADIGGTYARLGLHSKGQLYDLKRYLCSDFDSIESLLEEYFSFSRAVPTEAAIAVACIAHGDEIRFTNMSWAFSIKSVATQFGFIEVKVLNDLAALALAIPELEEEQLHKVGGGNIANGYAKGLIGVGTGLGVSGMLPIENGWVPIQGEGGHIRYGAHGKLEQELFHYMSPLTEYISAEYVLSGSGLVRLYKAHAQVADVPSIYNNPNDIVSEALARTCGLCVETLDVYCSILGDVAGDVALLLGAHGGVYLGGGVVGHIKDFLRQSDGFRTRFENKGAQATVIQTIPTFIILEPLAGLLGVAKSTDQIHRNIGVNYTKAADQILPFNIQH